MSIFPPTPPPPIFGAQDEGASLPWRGRMNFVGAGISAVDNAAQGRTDITVSGGGGGGGTFTSGEGARFVLTPSGGDDRSQLQAAFDATAAAGGGRIVINGILRLSNTCTYAGQGLTLEGQVPMSSGFAPISGTAATSNDLIVIAPGSGSNYPWSTVIRRLCWLDQTGSYWTSGSYPNRQTAGVGLHLQAGQPVYIDQCEFYNQFWGIKIGDSPMDATPHASLVRISNCFFWYAGGGAIWGVGGPGCHISHCLTFQTDIGVKWETRDTLQMDHCELVGCTYGVKVQQDVDSLPLPGVGRFDQVFVDQAYNSAFYFASALDYEVNGCGAFGAGYGVRVVSGGYPYTNGGQVSQGIRVEGGTFIACQGNSSGSAIISLESGTNHAVRNVLISNAMAHGIGIGSGVDGVHLTNNRITQDRIYPYSPRSSTAWKGFVFTGAKTNMMITGNDTRGMDGGAYSGTLPTGVVANNLPAIT